MHGTEGAGEEYYIFTADEITGDFQTFVYHDADFDREIISDPFFPIMAYILTTK